MTFGGMVLSGSCTLSPSNWPKQTHLTQNQTDCSEERREICVLVNIECETPIIPVNRFSSFTKLTRVTAWVMRFIANCRTCKHTREDRITSPLTVQEVVKAENYWISLSQRNYFVQEIEALSSSSPLPSNSVLLCLCPFVDSNGILRLGGREQKSKLSYAAMHPIILHRKIIRSITRGCTVRRNSEKPQPQLMGQLPMERVTPDLVFENVGVDYAGPVYVKYGHVRKLTVVKAYILCVFVSLSVKAVHLELVSNLSSDAFISALRRFIARRGKPTLIWSDNGTGAHTELKQFADFLENQKIQRVISEFCTYQRIQWKFIPERSPHFGGLWESTVKSMKYHLKRVTTNVKLTFEEFSTVITQIEACLNSRPLVALSCNDDGIEALTPGHFLIGRPLDQRGVFKRPIHKLALLLPSEN